MYSSCVMIVKNNCIYVYTCIVVWSLHSSRHALRRERSSPIRLSAPVDTFCPIGPLVPAASVPDPQALRLITRVNGEVMQDSLTNDMIFDVPTLIEFLSGSTTLLPGTVILTGTPSGVGDGRDPKRYLQPGDKVEVSIEGIGSLINNVVEEII